jgi:hypothetical protein
MREVAEPADPAVRSIAQKFGRVDIALFPRVFG